MEGSSEVDDIISRSSTPASAEFTHSGSVEAFFLEKKLFEFELNWIIFAILLWEQLVDLSGLSLSHIVIACKINKTIIIPSTEVSPQICSLEKLLWKFSKNL